MTKTPMLTLTPMEISHGHKFFAIFATTNSGQALALSSRFTIFRLRIGQL